MVSNPRFGLRALMLWLRMALTSPHLDVQLCEHIIFWYHNDNVPVEEIAQRINSSISTIYRILRQYNHKNTVLPSSPGQPRILSTEDIKFVSSLLDDIPVLFLDEIQDQLTLSATCHSPTRGYQRRQQSVIVVAT